jgi:hypothetical protein
MDDATKHSKRRVIYTTPNNSKPQNAQDVVTILHGWKEIFEGPRNKEEEEDSNLEGWTTAVDKTMEDPNDDNSYFIAQNNLDVHDIDLVEPDMVTHQTDKTCDTNKLLYNKNKNLTVGWWNCDSGFRKERKFVMTATGVLKTARGAVERAITRTGFISREMKWNFRAIKATYIKEIGV